MGWLCDAVAITAAVSDLQRPVALAAISAFVSIGDCRGLAVTESWLAVSFTRADGWLGTAAEPLNSP